MPETSIYENAGSVFPQYDVGFSWQPWIVKPISKSMTPQIFANNNLRFRVFCTNCRHVIMALYYG